MSDDAPYAGLMDVIEPAARLYAKMGAEKARLGGWSQADQG